MAERTAFFCKIDQKIKDNFDIAVIKNKKLHGSREEITEKLFKFFAKYGMPSTNPF